jgi:hypothetical protein
VVFFSHEFFATWQEKQKEAAKGTMMGVFWKKKWAQVVRL